MTEKPDFLTLGARLNAEHKRRITDLAKTFSIRTHPVKLSREQLAEKLYEACYPDKGRNACAEDMLSALSLAIFGADYPDVVAAWNEYLG